MENNIEIKETTIDEVLKVNKNVIEFSDDVNLNKEYFENRYQNKEHVKIVAYLNDSPIGYIVGYDKFNDGESFYVWMAGVDYKYRRKGALTKLMQYQIDWAKRQGYSKLKIKTRNARREMLSFLVKNEFNFTEVEKKENIIENRINLEKII
ncbi:MAG: GNAT family N-acetyltransferase [Clostridia bacterium]|jgi:GNAT superfamily N-acetyltransferase|nr:GNAT family N-acetyltransferase [Clostridia bacterium]